MARQVGRAGFQVDLYRLDVQLEVGKAVADSRQDLLRMRSQAKAITAMTLRIIVERQFGQTPEATPDTAYGAFLQHQFATIEQEQHLYLLFGQGLARP